MNTRETELLNDYKNILKLHSKSIHNPTLWNEYANAQNTFNAKYTEYERNVILPKILGD